MVVLEPQLRDQLEKALAEINSSLAASTKSRDLVERLLGSAGAMCGVRALHQLFDGLQAILRECAWVLWS